MDTKSEIQTLMARMARTSRADEKHRVLELIDKLPHEEKAFGLIQKSRTLMYLNWGRIKETLAVAKEAIEECKQINDKPLLLAAYVREISAYLGYGYEAEFSESVNIVDEFLASMTEQERKEAIASEVYYVMIKANRLAQDGKLLESISTYKKSIELGKQIPTANGYGWRWYNGYSNLAETYLDLGEVDKAYHTMLKYIEARDNDPTARPSCLPDCQYRSCIT